MGLHTPLLRSRITRSFSTIAIGALMLGAYEGCSSSETPSATPDAGPVAVPDANVIDTSLPPVGDDAADAGAPDASTDDAPVEADVPDSGFDCTTDADPNALPNDLRCTGLYSDWDAKTVATAVRPYTPGYVLWSDGAVKTRFIYLPPGATIDSTDMDDWVFPVGTKVWKEFRLGTQRIETRLFAKIAAPVGQASWMWTTYRWSVDESTATKLDGGETDVVGGNTSTYEVPSHNQCTQCHGGRKDLILGFDAIGLGASGAAGVTLATLAGQGFLSTAPPAALLIPEDSSGQARPALGWLHANCGAACHNPSGGALAKGTGLFLKVSATQIITGNGATHVEDLTSYKTAVNVVPQMQNFASQGYLRIKPGDASKSLIPVLDGSRNVSGVPQMPPIISHMVDTTGVAAVSGWINAMPIPDGGIVDAGGD